MGIENRTPIQVMSVIVFLDSLKFTRFSLETPCGLILYVGGKKLLPIAVFLKCYAKIAKFSELRAMIA